MNVVPGPREVPLSHVPASLRLLADEIERGSGARACIVVIDWCGPVNDYACALRAFGVEADPLRTIGMLRVASADLESLVNAGRVAR